MRPAEAKMKNKRTKTALVAGLGAFLLGSSSGCMSMLPVRGPNGNIILDDAGEPVMKLQYDKNKTDKALVITARAMMFGMGLVTQIGPSFVNAPNAIDKLALGVTKAHGGQVMRNMMTPNRVSTSS